MNPDPTFISFSGVQAPPSIGLEPVRLTGHDDLRPDCVCRIGVNSHGFTLLELVVAVAIGALVLLGIGGFYVSTLQFYSQSSSQAFLQRQGSLIIEEMARQIRPATALTRGVCNADSNSLQATNSLGVFCFYLNAGQISEDRPGGGTANLLSGSPVALTATSFTTALTIASGVATGATIGFQLSDNAQNSMTFQTGLSRRN